MDLSAMKDLYIGSTPVQSAWLGGTKVWERTPAVDIQAIKDAMLLWYDLKRQGATNESMAATPELVNLAYDPDKAHVIDWSEFSTNPGTEAYSITVQSNSYYWLVAQADWHKTHEIPSYYVQVENLPEGAVIYYFYGDGSDERQSYAITYNGLHKFPAGKISPNVNTGTGIFISNENGQTVADVVGTTITQVNPSMNATCYNFAWSGMSGIGGYVTNFIPREFEKDVTVLGTQKWRVNTIIHKEPIVANSNVFTGWNKTVTIVVDGLTDGSDDELLISHTTLSAFLHNGENVVTFGDTVADQYVTFKFLNTSLTNVTIEILPEYPNALVADGVDDYALVEGLPLLTKENGFTVVYKRVTLSDPNDVYKVFAAKRQGTQDAEHWGAFTLEKGPNVYPFGQINEITINTDDIGYMTPTSYCGQPIQSGNQVDYDHLALFCGADNGNEKQSVALYSFIVFNRTLTDDEIAWVKSNLIEGDTEL